MKPVIVKWRDIVSWTGWNDELIEKGLDEPANFTTIGFIVRQTETKLTISDTYPEMGSIVTFPIGCIDEIIELTERGKKPRKKDTASGE
jgi:hypothetical protein